MAEYADVDAPWAIIPARSEQEAMDWSLVLASQGIEAVIERAEEPGGWLLLVDPSHHAFAVRSIRQFRWENRAKVWRRPLPGTGLIFDARAAAWCFVWGVFFYLEQAGLDRLRPEGMMDSQRVRAGEWWRLFTAVTLHADLAHLIANITTGLLLLGLAMVTYGSGWGVLAAYLAGAGGNVASLCLHGDTHRNLGASGMVMGALGLLAVQSLVLWRHGLGARELVVRGIYAGVLLLVLMGFNPNSDVVAHVGGFVSGAMLGGLMALAPHRVWQAPGPNRLAELACAALMVLTWGLALR